MNRLLSTAAGLLCAFNFLAVPAVASPQVSSVIVLPPDFQSNPDIAGHLQKLGINHATVYVEWFDVEKRESAPDFSIYHAQFDKLVHDGMSLSIVLVAAPPHWVSTKHPDMFMQNFSGQSTRQPDFMHSGVRSLSARFMAQAVKHFSARYPKKVLGYAIGLQEEHEIKYGQTGYQWRNYSVTAQKAFIQENGNRLPIINYNNEIAQGVPKSEPLLNAHKQFRESALKEATCFYAKVIRDQGGLVINYFGEIFTSHDAIYATGIAEQLIDCTDIAVIDYNFFDGYRLVPDIDVLPMLANYMASVGYRKILVGAYAERWEERKKTAELIPVIAQTLSKALQQSYVIGYEVGGLQRQIIQGEIGTIDLEKLGKLFITPVPLPIATIRPVRIGLLASTTNFYVWHGERSGGSNPHRDALLESYRVLSQDPNFKVHVIGEKNLQPSDPLLQQLDVILVPHQAALPSEVKSKLSDFWKRGGALIQDMRLGEFDENGKATFDWMHEIFGIASIEWRRSNIFRMEDGSLLRLKPSRRYVGYASLKPRPGYRLLATELLDPQRGILLRGKRTLVFGAQPQLVDDVTQKAWHTLFLEEIRKVANTPPAK